MIDGAAFTRSVMTAALQASSKKAKHRKKGESEVLDYESSVPLYEQVSRHLRHAIQVGKYQPYKRIPTEEEPAVEYEVSRITIRRAVSELAAQGLVEKRQGKGTFVRPNHGGRAQYRDGLSFCEICRLRGQTTYSRLLEAGMIIAAKPEVNQSLGLAAGEPVVAISRVRYIDDKPCVVEHSFYPKEYCFLLGEDIEHISIYGLLKKEKQISVVAGELEISITKADEALSELLELEKDTPLMRVSFRNYRSDGNILHLCEQIGYPEGLPFIVR